MERRFHCTACGKCCFGWLPLTLEDALANADRFPLAMVWSPVRPGTKSFALTARLGTTVALASRKSQRMAIRVSPTSYVPPSLACPALTSERLCAIQEHKPLRCLAMPFSGYREEKEQGELLVPRPGWECETSSPAPVVYRTREVLPREAFDRERRALLEQAPTIRAYADQLLARAPSLSVGLEKAAARPTGGHVVLAFTPILSRLEGLDVADFARRQFPVLRAFASRVAGQSGLEDYLRHYHEGAVAMERYLARS